MRGVAKCVAQRKSAGLVFILDILGLSMFGIDRFYCGQNGFGALMLILTLSIIGIPVSLIVSFVSMISSLVTLITGSTTSFAYPGVTFSRGF